MNENLIGKRVIEKNKRFPRKGEITMWSMGSNCFTVSWFGGGEASYHKTVFDKCFEILTGLEAIAPRDIVIFPSGSEHDCIQVLGDLYWYREQNGDVCAYPNSIQYDKSNGYKIKNQEEEPKKPKWHDISEEEFLECWKNKTPVWVSDNREDWRGGAVLTGFSRGKEFPYMTEDSRIYRHASITDPNDPNA